MKFSISQHKILELFLQEIVDVQRRDLQYYQDFSQKRLNQTRNMKQFSIKTRICVKYKGSLQFDQILDIRLDGKFQFRLTIPKALMFKETIERGFNNLLNIYQQLICGR
ncbi:unnamed protein product [Paramecium octaurelia]|uniref:Uncharacterized protein n=1 Tax=Paramecium octaurelia TaxID=43137 RepID=A0A8S1X6G2_PAROT|nr:unnamed protein product [Paramecium octaurelia]